jgi:DNA-binding FadR family transcriptional regulator
VDVLEVGVALPDRDDAVGAVVEGARLHAAVQVAVDRTREQHVAIYEAIAARQPEVARAWATVHIAGVEDWLRRALLGR